MPENDLYLSHVQQLGHIYQTAAKYDRTESAALSILWWLAHHLERDETLDHCVERWVSKQIEDRNTQAIRDSFPRDKAHDNS